jgi:hypothetical protein
MVTNDARCICESKYRIAMAKAACNEKIFFSINLVLDLRRKVVKCYIWSIALYGAEAWKLQGAGQKYAENFGMWCWRSMEKISWADCVRNGVKEERKSYIQ